MPLDFTLDRTATIPLYRQITIAVRRQIAKGELPPNTRLPTVRELARELRVTTQTVQAAYDDLRADGWIDATVGRGTFVRASVQARDVLASVGDDFTPDGFLTDEGRIQSVKNVLLLGSSDPDPLTYPAEAFRAALNEAMEDVSLLSYGYAQGDERLRVALAEYTRERGVAAAPDSILVTRGVTHALSLVTQVLAEAGDTVLVGSPTYLGFLNLLRAQRVEPLGLPFDDEGPLPDVLEDLLHRKRPRFLYLIPTYHNPTGLSMSPTRRRELLGVAHRHGLLVIEDDIYGRLPLAGPSPASLYAECPDGLVIYLDGFSKVLMPALRIGYIVAPPALLKRVRFLRQAEDLCGSAFTERALALFLEPKHHRPHLASVLPRLRKKRDALLEALCRFMPEGITWSVPEGGFNLWVTLPPGLNTESLYHVALERGVAFAPGQAFLTSATKQHHFRLCFGMYQPDDLTYGVEVLASLVHDHMNGRLSTPRGGSR